MRRTVVQDGINACSLSYRNTTRHLNVISLEAYFDGQYALTSRASLSVIPRNISARRSSHVVNVVGSGSIVAFICRVWYFNFISDSIHELRQRAK